VDRPRVIVHNTVSLDGRLTGFPVDLGLHYEIAGSIPHDAILTGSGTLLAAARAEGVDLSGEDPDEPAPAEAAADKRPWLVVVDSRARLTRLAWLRGQPHWRDVLVLCSQTTPVEHLDRLRRHRVEHVVAGTDRVDLPAALGTLVDRYHVTAVRVDAGGILNGQLLAAGLVDEIDIVVAPHLAGTGGADPIHLVDGVTGAGGRLSLVDVRQLRDSHLRLRYTVASP
jgi:2,5-diamino-6-(ribosylamino)-4(3H)-pyrimidinone 5'-phosphate reductase